MTIGAFPRTRSLGFALTLLLGSFAALGNDKHAAAPPKTDAEALAQRSRTPTKVEAAPGSHAAAAAKPAVPTKPVGTKATAPEIVAKLLSGNGRFEAEHPASYFAPFAKSQAPKVTLLTCSDSRVHTHLFGGNPDNALFVIRNIGNQTETAQGSIDYGIQHLATPVLMIVGHTGCGAVKAAMGDFHDEDEDIVHELTPLVAALEPESDDDFDHRWGRNVQANVDFQVRQALAAYAERVQTGDLTVVGAIYDFQNLFGKGFGALIVVNVNGQVEPSSLRKQGLFQKLGAQEIEAHLARF